MNPSSWDVGTGICGNPEKTLEPGVGEMEDRGSPVGADDKQDSGFREEDERVREFGKTKTVALTSRKPY